MKNPVFLALIATGAILTFPHPVNPQSYDYAQNRGVSIYRRQRLDYYAKRGQTARDVRQILGVQPNRVGRDWEAYTISQSVDYYQGVPLNAGRQLIVHYGRDGKTSTWYDY